MKGALCLRKVAKFVRKLVEHRTAKRVEADVVLGGEQAADDFSVRFKCCDAVTDDFFSVGHDGENSRAHLEHCCPMWLRGCAIDLCDRTRRLGGRSHR